MLYRILADLTLILHLLFILFVLLGGLLVLWQRRIAWLHLPVAGYGVLVEWVGWLCPLTPLEVRFRLLAGQAGYTGGFIEHYLVPLIYPAGLTRELQWLFGALVLVLNLAVYAMVLSWAGRERRTGP